jgi:hypothetical protein
LKEEFGKLNIYKKGKRDGMFVTYMRKENTITFEINFKEEKFSYEINLHENSIKEVVT